MKNEKSISQRMINYLNVLLRIVLVILIIILLHSIYQGLKQDGYIIQPIQTPKSFTDSGLSGVVIANKIQDKLVEIKANTKSSRQDSLQIKANRSNDLRMDVMGIGISSTSLIFHLRDLLNIETKTISGDLTDLDNQLTMTIRVHNFPVKVITESYEDKTITEAFENLTKNVAGYIMSCTDPYYQTINLYQEYKYEEAHDLIREMILNRPEEKKWAYLAWGNMMLQQNNREKAQEYFKSALEVDENFALPNKGMAWQSAQDQEYGKAIEYFNKALIERPDDWSAINGLAQCHSTLGESEEAEKYYKLNLDKNPDQMWSYMTYANYYIGIKKDTQRAVEIFSNAKDKVTQNDDYYLTLAGLHYFQTQEDSALFYVQKSLDFNPNNVEAMGQMAGYLMSNEINDPAAAIPYLKKAINIRKVESPFNSGLLSSYNMLAMAEWRAAQYDSAFVHVQKAIDIAPSVPIPYTTLAEIHLALGNRKAFYREMQKAFDLGLIFQEDWFEDEPYKFLKNDNRFLDMIEKSKAKTELLD